MKEPLTKAEAELVIDLIKLWHAAWDDGPCRRDCTCAKCQAYEQAGDHLKATFDSLQAKASSR